MRLAILSDVHGNIVALEAVLADVRSRGVDLTVNLGDCVTSPLWPRETWTLLDALALPTVRGNHDRWLVEEPSCPTLPRSVAFARDALDIAQRESLAALPASLTLAEDVLAVHGTPESDEQYLLEERVQHRLALAPAALLRRRLDGVPPGLVLCGHSHHAHVAQAGPRHLVVNPGSVGCPRYADDGAPDAEPGSPHARYAIATRRRTGWQVELLALPYQFDRVARQAIANGREDWAAAFLR